MQVIFKVFLQIIFEQENITVPDCLSNGLSSFHLSFGLIFLDPFKIAPLSIIHLSIADNRC